MAGQQLSRLRWQSNSSSNSAFCFAERPQHHESAETEADHGAQGGRSENGRAEAQPVGKNSRERKNQSQQVKPEASAYWIGRLPPQTKLQQERRQSDRRNDNESQGAEECSPTGVDDHQSQCQQ
jgi:hypothetical protein